VKHVRDSFDPARINAVIFLTDGKNEFRGYKSRSGHRFLLDDSAKKKITLADKTDMLVNIHSTLQMPSKTPVLTVLDPGNCADAVARILAVAG